MENTTFFQLNPNILPKIRLIDSVSIQPPYVHKKRKIDEYIIYVIKKGNMYLIENNRKYVLSSGDFFLLDSKFYHEGFKESFCEYYYVHFQHDQIDCIEFGSEQEIIESIITKRNDSLKSDAFSYASYDKDQCIFPKKYHFSNYNDFIKVCCLLDEAIKHNENHLENYKVLCSCEVLKALIETFRSFVLSEIENLPVGVPKSYIKVHELLNYLNTEYSKKITSESIEKIFHCNFDYVNRIFKKLTQKTIFVYLNAVRMNHAKELIANTNLKISEVGQVVGFCDVYSFSKTFKKSTGVSPVTYAKSLLKK